MKPDSSTSSIHDRLLELEKHFGLVKEEPVMFVITPDHKWKLEFFIPRNESERYYASMNNLFDCKGRALVAKCEEIK